ncbi:MAG: type IV secretion system DNA-binding domain-containing protein [Candidatus Bathyarchaeia archaeon]
MFKPTHALFPLKDGLNARFIDDLILPLIWNDPGIERLCLLIDDDSNRWLHISYFEEVSEQSIEMVRARYAKNVAHGPKGLLDNDWTLYELVLRDPYQSWSPRLQPTDLLSNSGFTPPSNYFQLMKLVSKIEETKFLFAVNISRLDPASIIRIARSLEISEIESGDSVTSRLDKLLILRAVKQEPDWLEYLPSLREVRMFLATDTDNYETAIRLAECISDTTMSAALDSMEKFTSIPYSVGRRLFDADRVSGLISPLMSRNPQTESLCSVLAPRRSRNGVHGEKEVVLGMLGQEYSLASGCDVFLDHKARTHHLWIWGQTGTGKTSLLKNIVQSDLSAGRSVIVLDPHGDLATAAWRAIPRSRKADSVLLDFTSPEPPCLDVFEYNKEIPYAKERAVNNLLDMIISFWKVPEFTGPIFTNLMSKALFLLFEAKDAGMNVDLFDLERIFLDAEYLERLLACVQEETIKKFWESYLRNENTAWSKDRYEISSYVSSKVISLISGNHIRKILQGRSEIDYNAIAQGRQILVVNLNRSFLGEIVSRFISKLLLFNLRMAFMRRGMATTDDPNHVYLYIDEAQWFVDDEIDQMLSEMRKYGVSLCGSNQYISQFQSEKVVQSILGNVGNLISFRVGIKDAKLLADTFGNDMASRLVQLPNYEAICRLTVKDVPTKPLIIHTYPPKEWP